MSSQADSDGLTGDTISMQRSEQQSTIPTTDCINAMETITSKSTTAQDKKLEKVPREWKQNNIAYGPLSLTSKEWQKTEETTVKTATGEQRSLY